MSSPPSESADARRKRRHDRAIVSLLGRVKWLAVGLLIPMILIPLLLWGGHGRTFGWFVIGYFAFALSVPAACEVVRRHLVGTGSHYDHVELAVLSGVAILLLVAGGIRFC